jgi:hypothetical protein
VNQAIDHGNHVPGDADNQSSRWPANRQAALQCYLRPVSPKGFRMSVSLTKIDGASAADALANSQIVACPQCSQRYRLAYSDSEWNKVKDWLHLAETALRKDLKSQHEATAIPLQWRGIHKR